jgi:cob(I)alamin adenosyltransferase
VITLARTTEVAGPVIRYLNRLSDLLFAMARAVNARAAIDEPEWLGLDSRPRE